MNPSTEERLASLEQKFNSVEEGIGRLEKSLEKVANTVSELMEKLDARYPSQEGVNLRFATAEKEVQELRNKQAETAEELERIKKRVYMWNGGLVVISFLLGLAARAWNL